MSPLAALTAAPALRDDIRRLGDLLGEALIRQEGSATYEIVERIRALSRDDPDGAAELIDELPLARGDHPGPGLLAVLPPGQHRRAGAPVPGADCRARQHRRPAGGGWGGDPRRSGGRSGDRSGSCRRVRPDQRAPGLHRAPHRGVPPLGPGQAAAHRRAARRAPYRRAPTARSPRRSTCCGRPTSCGWASPKVTDEARNALFYLDDLAAGAAGDVVGEFAAAAHASGLEVPAGRPVLTFGSWIGGDRDGNPFVTPAVTARVLAIQHDHAVRDLLPHIEDLSARLSVSERIAPVSAEFAESLAADLAALPDLDPRFARLNAEEPYRLKLTCIHAKLRNTRARQAEGLPPRAGRDYRTTSELLADLELIRASLAANRGGLIAAGSVARTMRVVAVFGLSLATLDIREHSNAHHHAVGQLLDRLGELDTPYAQLTAEQRFTVLAAELSGKRPLAPAPPPLDPAGTDHLRDVRRDRPGAGPLRPGDLPVLHHLDDEVGRRRAGRRGAGARGRAGGPPRRGCPDRLRPAARDRCRADGRRRARGAAPRRSGVPRAGAPARGHPRGDARLLGLEQGRRGHDVAVADPPGPAPAARRVPGARCRAAAVPRTRGHRGPRRWSDLRGDPVPALGRPRRADQGHRAGRGHLRQVPAARSWPGRTWARRWPPPSGAPSCTAPRWSMRPRWLPGTTSWT